MDKRKHKRSRRFLSALMVLAMLISLLPAGAYATAPAEDSTTADIVEQTTTNEPEGSDVTEPDGDVTDTPEGTEPTEPTEPAPPTDPEPEEPAGDDGTEAELQNGVNIIQAGAENTTYNIGDDQVVMIANQAKGAEPITFTNCTFNLSGKTVKISGDQDGISYNNGEVVTKLFISGAVNFENCRFVTADGASKSSTAGYDAAIYFYSGEINVNSCTVEAEGYNGQFLGLYGREGAVTFKDSNISTVGNKNGWSYAMYAGSVLKLNHSTMTATGSSTDSGNINCFYSGDNKTGYDAIFIDNGSVVDFSDNQAGGFAINNVNIHVNDSSITVNDNLGNACNSGYWIVDNSNITMNGNRGGHALSCIGFEMTDSKFEVQHNGYAGVYLQSKDSSLTSCTVDIRCNGENLLSYSAGDVWLQNHKLTVNGGTSDAQEGSPWLGGVGRKGAVVTENGTSIVAYDLNSNAADNLKSNTEPVLTNATLALNGDGNEHTLLLNPFMKSSDYARGNGESNHSDNDADLFEDQNITDIENYSEILGADNAKIGELTDAQLSHHKYDWNAGKVKYAATKDTYGALAYPCTDVCASYVGHTTDHPYSRDCEGTYVYAPLVGLGFDANAGDDKVTDMPSDQTTIAYQGTGTEPVQTPVRTGTDDQKYVFTGWYADKEGKTPFDFDQALEENWTVAYAGWKAVDDNEITITPADITIYTGGESYEGVVGDLEDEFEEAGTSKGLPEPGYYITLPDWLNDLVKITNESEGVETGAADLSEYSMTFTYYGEDGDQIVTRNWPLKLYSEVNGGTSYQTDVKIDGVTRDRYIYQLEPSGENEVRVQFRPLDADGNVIENSTPILGDDLFGFDLGNLYERYDMTIYPGFLKQQDVKAQITVDGTTYTLPVTVDHGVLTIRGASEDATNVTISNDPAAIQPVENKATGVTTAVVAPSGTNYYINDHHTGSMVSVDPTNVRLLTDVLATSDAESGNETAAQTILKDYIVDDMGIASADANYQYQYMDLVDTSNGNAWVTATKPVDIYWKLPDNTNTEDYEFQIVHFQGLDREYDDVDKELANNEQIVYSEENNNLTVETIGNDQYLKFSTQTFSPFVLVWDEAGSDNPGGGGWIPGGGGDPDTPDLNTEDHFSYIVGYPEDYRTGEATDDESLWPVKPQGNITRAEVATIFYRLLTDEARTENWTRDNAYTDVAADSWYNTPVSTLGAMGIVRGYEDGSFRPDAPITRAEFAAIAVRFFENDNVNYEEGLFTDITGSEWFADAVAAAQENGIVGGYPDGSFQPNKAITRAEATSIVNRTVDRIPDKDHLLPENEMRVWPDNSDPDIWYYADMQEATSGHDYEWILDDNDEPLCEQWTGDLPEVDWVQVEIDQEEKHGLR